MSSEILQKIGKVGKWYLYCNRKGPYALYPLNLIDRSICEGWQGHLGKFWLELVINVFSNNGWAEVYEKQSDVDELERVVFDKIIREKDFIRKTFSGFEKQVKVLKKCQKGLEQVDITDNKLAAGALSKFHQAYISSGFFGVVGWWGGREPLAKYLKNYLLDKTDKDFVNEYFKILSSPLEPSFTFEEKTSLLKISQVICKDSVLKKIFSTKNPEQVRQLLQGQILNVLQTHTKKFAWIPFDYNGPTLYNELYFISTIKDIIEAGNIGQELDKQKNYFEKLKQRQELLFKKLAIDQQHERLFKDLQAIALLQDFKKEVYTKVHLTVWRFLQKIAQNRGVPDRDLTWLTAKELEEFILNNDLSEKEIQKRKEFCVVITFPETVRVFVGDDALAIAKIIRGKSEDQKFQYSKKTGVVNGQPASGGKVKGIVKIILDPDEIKDMSIGGVLVTRMTTPVFVPAMKKAIAVITDEGGITCHAAIVSRELGIPCIIGTKNATQILKDGDVVEVDASKGIIKIIK